MPRHTLFAPLPLLAHMTRVRLRYCPGTSGGEVCAHLERLLNAPATAKQFPKLTYMCQIIQKEESAASTEVEFELTNGKIHRFVGGRHSLQEMQLVMDQDQFGVYLESVKEKPIDRPVDD